MQQFWLISLFWPVGKHENAWWWLIIELFLNLNRVLSIRLRSGRLEVLTSNFGAVPEVFSSTSETRWIIFKLFLKHSGSAESTWRTSRNFRVETCAQRLARANPNDVPNFDQSPASLTASSTFTTLKSFDFEYTFAISDRFWGASQKRSPSFLASLSIVSDRP